MLEKINLKRKLTKADYKAVMADLEPKIAELQRRARKEGVPLAIVFEGWDAAGKGTLINNLILALDPRGSKVHPISAPTPEEELRPWLWRFWIRTPAKGRIAVFDRSWYGRVLVERGKGNCDGEDLLRSYAEINSFEQQLADSGTVLVKFLLHIDKKEQKKRFEKLLSNPSTAWKVGPDDKRRHRHYRSYLKAYDEMLEKTGTEWAPWTIVEAHDKRFATVKVFTSVIEALERQLNAKAQPQLHHPSPVHLPQGPVQLSPSILKDVDLSAKISRPEYDSASKKLQKRILELEHEVFLKRIPVVIVYEGWDAAGKGGNIKRLVRGMDPRGYEVVPFAAPTNEEKLHHYLWRFWRVFPKAGHITIFDRSWYGRVLVERVEGFCSEEEWSRAYREINETEQQWVDFGAVVIKFWLHIDKEEQLRRFEARQQTPHKQWKITDEDWRNREKWDVYRQAVEEMLLKTSTTYAPWTIIEANSKLFGRIKAMKTVRDRLEEVL